MVVRAVAVFINKFLVIRAMRVSIDTHRPAVLPPARGSCMELRRMGEGVGVGIGGGRA